MAEPESRVGRPATVCPNCGRPAGPRFCGDCGQPLDDRRRPVLRLAREVLADWLSLDSRLLRSLAALLRPGRLTILYLDGKRAPYLRPLRLYLLASLVLFSTVLTLDPPDADEVNIYIGDKLINAGPSGKVRKSIQIVNPKTGFGRWIQNHYADKLESFQELPPQQLLDSLFSSLRRYLPGALILFVPFLAGGLKLLYRRRKALYLDHLVFSLHFQSALFFALAAAWLIGKLLRLELVPGLILQVVAALLMLTVYLGAALHRVHPRSRWRTAVRVLFVTFIYMTLMNWALGAAVAAAIREM